MRMLLPICCLLLFACEREQASAPVPETAPAAPAVVPVVPTTPPAVVPAPEVPSVAEPDAEAAAAKRRAAQAYLDSARESALQAQRDAKARCEAGVADYDACIAAADEAFEAAMRNARVEFDARMREE